MATKPNIALARFADTGAAVVVDPPSGLRDTGFVRNDPIDEGTVNALFRQNYLWAKYLSEGALSGDHSVDGMISAAKLRLATAGRTIDQVAPAGMTSSYTLTWPVSLPGATQYLAVDPAGNITLGGRLTTISIPILAPFVSTGALSAPPASQGFNLSGSGSGANSLWVQVPAVLGSTLKAFRARVKDNTSGGGGTAPTRVQMALQSTVEGTAAGTLIATSVLSNGSGVEQTIPMTVPQNASAVVAQGTRYWINVSTAFSQSGGAQCSVYHLEMDYVS